MIIMIRKWFMATRPASLWISTLAVVMGTIMSASDGGAHLPSALMALLGAVLIHVGCNLTNDYWDYKRGSNQLGDVDPMRGIAVGEISQGALKIACVATFILALIPCGYLISRGGWPIFLIALLSFLSAIFYTAGNKSLAYQGWGDLFAFVFFGPVAVAGTYYVQLREMNPAVILCGIAPGLLTVAVLTINNIRDWDKDRRINKKTLTVRFGKKFSYYEYLACIIGTALTPVLVYSLTRDHFPTLLATAVGFAAIPGITTVLQAKDEMAFNHAIGGTIQILMLYTFIFSIGWIF